MSAELATTLPPPSPSEATDGPIGAGTLGPLSLRLNFSWTIAGNIVYITCQWGMVVLLARLGSPEMVGQFVLGLAITAPVIIFAELHLRAVQATDAKGEYFFGHYLALRLLSTPLAMLVIAGIVVLAGYRLEMAMVILAIGVAKGLESISDIFYGFFQRHERMDRIALSRFIKGPLSILLMGIGIYFTKSLLAGVLGILLARALTLCTYDVWSALGVLRGAPRVPAGGPKSQSGSSLRPCWQARSLTSLAWRALPLGIVMILISLSTNIPRYFIDWYFGQRALGIFATMAYFVVAGSLLVQALGQAATPKLAKHYADRRLAEFRSLTVKLLAGVAVIGVATIVLAMVAGREILTIVYGSDYACRSDVFVWLMVGLALSAVASILGYAITATRLFRHFTIPYGMVTVVAVLCSALLIPTFGLVGAAWTVCAVALSNCVAPLVIFKRAWKQAIVSGPALRRNA